MDLPLRLLVAVQEHFSHPADAIIAVPDREMWVASHRQNIPELTIIALELDAHTTFDRRSALQMRTHHNRPLPSWSRPLAACALYLMDAGWVLQGGKFLFVGDEPLGIRYEHALALGLLAFWHEALGVPCDGASLLEQADRAMRHYLPTS